MEGRILGCVAFGGLLGALARLGVVTVATRWFGSPFPWGTFLVNASGCLLAGIAMAALESLHEQKQLEMFVRYGFVVGFLGAYTTFSAFGVDTLKLENDHQFALAALNVLANVSVGLTLAWIGLRLGREWF
jgi:CrcB protein